MVVQRACQCQTARFQCCFHQVRCQRLVIGAIQHIVNNFDRGGAAMAVGYRITVAVIVGYSDFVFSHRNVFGSCPCAVFFFKYTAQNSFVLKVAWMPMPRDIGL